MITLRRRVRKLRYLESDRPITLAAFNRVPRMARVTAGPQLDPFERRQGTAGFDIELMLCRAARIEHGLQRSPRESQNPCALLISAIVAPLTISKAHETQGSHLGIRQGRGF